MMDKKDEQILQLFQHDPRQGSNSIAKKVNVSSATVRRRLKRLFDSNEINVIAYRDPVKAGLPVAVLIGFNIDHNLLDEVADKLTRLPEVAWFCATTGRFDGFAFLRFASNESMAFLIRNTITGIEGIKDSETFICLNDVKRCHF